MIYNASTSESQLVIDTKSDIQDSEIDDTNGLTRNRREMKSKYVAQLLSDKIGDADRNTTVSVDAMHFFELFNNNDTSINSTQQRNLLLQTIADPTLLSSSTDMAVLPLSTSK